MAAIMQKTFLTVFSWMKMFEFWFKFHWSCVPDGQLKALVQIMAWHWKGDKPLSEPMMVSLLTHICITWPQLVKASATTLQSYDLHIKYHSTIWFHSPHIQNMTISIFYKLDMNDILLLSPVTQCHNPHSSHVCLHLNQTIAIHHQWL